MTVLSFCQEGESIFKEARGAADFCLFRQNLVTQGDAL